MLDEIRAAANEILSVPGSIETGSVSIVSSAIGDRLAVTDYSGEMIDGIASLLNTMFNNSPRNYDRVGEIAQTSDALIAGVVSLDGQAKAVHDANELDRKNLATVIDMTYPDQLGGLHPSADVEAARITEGARRVFELSDEDKKRDALIVAKQAQIDRINADLARLYAGNDDEFAIAA